MVLGDFPEMVGWLELDVLWDEGVLCLGKVEITN